MPKTEFGEQQLRDCVNNSLIEHARLTYNIQLFPYAPTPHMEKVLGWDNGFYIPGLGGGHQGQFGCNLFIQYKRSQPYTGRWGMFGDCWQNHDYYMFYLAHQVNGQVDFHQQYALIDLNNQGYTVVYVTNHVWQLNDLMGLYLNNRLLTDLPVMRVSPTIRNHVKATFTDPGTHFKLHSEPIDERRINLNTAIEETKATEYEKDIKSVRRFITDFEGTEFNRDNKYEKVLYAFHKLLERNEIDDSQRIDENTIEGLALRYYLKYYVNLHWFRFYRD